MKGFLLIACTLLILGAVLYLLNRDNSKVGHYISEEGKADFQSAYEEAMLLLPKPQVTKDIETEFGIVRVYYFTNEENKDKEPILLLPGRSSSTPLWEPNLLGLMKERPIYTIDLLGEPGMSHQTKAISSEEDQAKWLNEVLVALKLEKVHLMGVSIGGWTSMNLARYYPERIVSISLLDPVFVFEPIALKMIAASIPASVPFVPKFIREKMLSYISGGAKADESEPIAKLIEAGMRNYKLKLPAPDQLSDEDLKNIDIPILAFMAENSTMHDAEKAVIKGKAMVKNIEIESWPHASHAISGEYPDEINARVLEFVEQHATRLDNVIQ
jgi:pimeloyl-ACP methyl ester carboxylesterase